MKNLSDLDPVDVFRKRWASRYEGEPPAEIMAAFDDLLAEARGETAPVARARAVTEVLS
jgi:hypothetical protein